MGKLKYLVLLMVFSKTSFAQKGFCDIENRVINPGENVDFIVYYNLDKIWIPAGKVSFSTKLSTLSGVPVYHVLGRGSTLKSYEWIYKVDDVYESFIDTATLQTMKFVRNINENGKRKLEYVRLVSQKNKAFANFKTFSIPDCTQDVLSSVYYARNLDYSKMQIGSILEYDMFLEEQVYHLYIRYLGKQRITTNYGTFNTIKLKPLLVKGTVFKGGEDMEVYVSDDDNRIPIRVKSKILVGSIIVDMVAFSGQKHPVNAFIKKNK
ncbi:MAG TPA: DUF3108 domain-containing protein [Edaphocola sp.]|nr:DUF3108 domain-containing protein [Edaphocola sp.]